MIISFSQERRSALAKQSVVLMLTALGGLYISSQGVAGAVLLAAIPILLCYLWLLVKFPRTGIVSMLVMDFLIAGLTRYFPGIPYGLSLDMLILLTFLALLIKEFRKVNFSPAACKITFAVFIWFLYCVFEIFNPLARSVEAWFYSVRGLALYMTFVIPLGILVFNKRKDLDQMLGIWMVMVVIAVAWGAKQLFMGVSATEQAWLDAGAANTHVLFGRLRVFSFYSDAGQFGANMAYSALVFGIIAAGKHIGRSKFVFATVSAIALYGMAISGTRGALAVLATGGLIYLLLSKRFLILLIGISFAVGSFVFLKYTTIGQSNYQIQRMRSALNPSDASLMVRKNREKQLAVYMADKPIGAGIGSAGSWGQRFSPGSYLAELGTDSHFVRVWAECGVIGLWVHIAVLGFILMSGFRILWRMEDSSTRERLVALYAGICGVTAASYGNGVITQIPTGLLVYLSIAFLVTLGKKNFRIQKEQEEKTTLTSNA